MRVLVVVLMLASLALVVAGLVWTVPTAPTPTPRTPTPWVETRVVIVVVTATPTATATGLPIWASRTAEAKTPHPSFPTLVPETATA